VAHRPWADYALISGSEVVALLVTAWWLLRRLNHPRALEVFLLSFLAATIARYMLRKELLAGYSGLAPRTSPGKRTLGIAEKEKGVKAGKGSPHNFVRLREFPKPNYGRPFC
jgi:hypothetical protein